jgi:hypothetical protein
VKTVRRRGAESANPARAIISLPAVRALFLQVLSFFLALLITSAVWAIFGIPISPSWAACMQGACATALSYWRGLASWWLVIQFLFPVALVLSLSLQLPPLFFLAAFLVFLFLYWSTFRTQVPFYPSGLAVWNAVADLLPQERDIALVDIGSGLGGLTLNLSRRFPDGRFSGIEIAPLPWLISLIRARLIGSAARFSRNDYNNLHLADYDVVFAYLSPVAMPDLWRKAKAEMREGGVLLSYEFDIPGVQPSSVISPMPNGASLYLFRM